MFLIALVMGIVGGANLYFAELREDPGKYFFRWAVQAVIATIVSGFVLYFGLPESTGPMWGEIGVLVFAYLAVFAFVPIVQNRRRIDLGSIVECGAWIPFCLFLVMGLRSCEGRAFWTSDQKVKLLGDVQDRKWTDDMTPVSDSHIRMVSEDQAEWYGNKCLGEVGTAGLALGSRYMPGVYTIQRVGDKLVWVAPLEFRNFSAWQTAHTVPGFIVMSAEDPHQQATLVTKIGDRDLNMRYMPQSYFGDNLDRYLWQNGYNNVHVHDYHFELDDDYHPHWVVSVTVPTAGFSNLMVKEALIVDPETGKIDRYDIDKVPAWVDRVYPQDVVAERISDWGEYSSGWWNANWGNASQVEAASESLPVVWDDRGNASWFTGLTSKSKHDNSLLGVMLVNTRTGAATKYDLSGSDENGVKQAVETAVANYSGWTPTQPVLYNINGRLAWVVPIVSQKIFQDLAIVDAETCQVSLGKTKELALAEFRKGSSGSGNSVAPSVIAKMASRSIHVDRINQDGQTGQYFIWTKEIPDHVFVGTLSSGSEIALTVPGDIVVVHFVDTKDKEVSISKIENAQIDNIQVENVTVPLKQ